MNHNEALDLLREATSQAQSRGALTYSAGLKPRMQKLSAGSFSESDLGFASFRAFLEAASADGVVVLAPVASGDVQVLLPGQDPDHGEEQPTGRPIRRIRDDLWKAFVAWEDGTTRLYDTLSNRAVVLSPERASREQNNQPNRFLLIKPQTRSDTQRMMREFLATAPHDERADLDVALSSPDDGERRFVESMTTDTRRAWRRFQLEEVGRRIRSWAQNAGIDLNISAPPINRSAHTPLAATAVLDRSSIGNAASLRQEVLAAVARMSLSELLRIAIPAEYLLGSADRHDA